MFRVELNDVLHMPPCPPLSPGRSVPDPRRCADRWIVLSLSLGACGGLPRADSAPPIAVEVLTVERSAVSPAGEVVATLSAPPLGLAGEPGRDVVRAVHLWSLRTGEPLRRIGGSEHPVREMDFSPDGRLLATAGHSTPAALWEVGTGRRVRDLSADTLTGWVRYGPRGEQVLLEGQEMRIVDPVTGKVLHRPGLRTFQPAFSPDGRLLAGPYRYRAGVWDIAGDSLLRVVGPEIDTRGVHHPSTQWVEFSPDGRRLLLTGFGVGPSEWDVATGEVLVEWYHLPPATSDDIVAELGRYSPRGGYVLTHIETGTDAWLWDAGRHRSTQAGESPRVAFRSDAVMLDAAFSPDERHLLTTHWDASTRVWCVATGEELFRRYLLGGGGWLAVAPDGHYEGDAATLARVREVAEIAGAQLTGREEGLVGRVMRGGSGACGRPQEHS